MIGPARRRASDTPKERVTLVLDGLKLHADAEHNVTGSVLQFSVAIDDGTWWEGRVKVQRVGGEVTVLDVKVRKTLGLVTDTADPLVGETGVVAVAECPFSVDLEVCISRYAAKAEAYVWLEAGSNVRKVPENVQHSRGGLDGAIAFKELSGSGETVERHAV